MENITLGQIGLGVAFVVSLVSGIAFLHSKLKKWVTSALKDELTCINTKLDTLQTRVETVDLEHCKNYLVKVISDIENGRIIDEVAKERFFEQYQHYCEMGGNSYIKRKVDQLIKEGKL